jgi:hypothetical protein
MASGKRRHEGARVAYMQPLSFPPSRRLLSRLLHLLARRSAFTRRPAPPPPFAPSRMEAALAARFGLDKVQLEQAVQEGLRSAAEALLLSQADGGADAQVALASWRVRCRALLCNLYASLELDYHTQTQLKCATLYGHITDGQASSRLWDDEAEEPEERLPGLGALSAVAEGAPQLLCHAFVRLAGRPAGGAADTLMAAEECLRTLRCLLKWLAAQAAHGSAAALRSAARELAECGALAAALRLLACTRSDILLTEVARHHHRFVNLVLAHVLGVCIGRTPAHTPVADALPPDVLAACEDPAFLARLPVLVGCSFGAAQIGAAAELVACVAEASPRAAAALAASTRAPALMPLLLVAADRGLCYLPCCAARRRMWLCSRSVRCAPRRAAV